MSEWKFQNRLNSNTYVESKKSAVTQVDTLQSADILLTVARLLHDSTTVSRKSMNTPVSDGSTFDKTNALKLGKVGQLSNALIGEVATTGQINVSDASTALGQSDDGCVGDTSTVAEVNVVEITAKLGNGPYGSVGELSALGKNQVAQLRARLHNLVNGLVSEFLTIRKVKNPQGIERSSLGW